MIGRIRGKLLARETQRVLVDVQGVGYELEVPLPTLFKLPALGEPVSLHTHLVAREDAQLLYGFMDERERSLFRVLIKINGVGPKLALAILSGMEVDELVNCVRQDDVESLVKLPGVGRKTAERLIIEARDRLKEWRGDEALGGDAGAPAPGRASSMAEAETALASLGYKPRQASEAVLAAMKLLEENGQELTSEVLIRTALKNMG